MAHRAQVIALLVASFALLGLPAHSQDTEAPPTAPPMETYAYKTVGDCEIKADVYRLPGDEDRPAILWIHGGR